MSNIALIGFMGSGKTVVGRMLAERLGYSYIDVDTRIEETTGWTIPEIFKSEGEDGFRAIETKVLGEVLAGGDNVISCGGGVIIREENREMLRRMATVVYLKAGPEELYRRVGRTGDKRPLLNVADPKAEIARLLSEREPLYMEIADVTIDTTGKRPREVAELAERELRMRGYPV